MTSLQPNGNHWRISRLCADLSTKHRGDKTLLICTFNDWSWHLMQIVQLMSPAPINIDVRFKELAVWLVLICPPSQLERPRRKLYGETTRMDCMTCGLPTATVYIIPRAGKRLKICPHCAVAFGNPLHAPPVLPSPVAHDEAAQRANDEWYEGLDLKRQAGWRSNGYVPAKDRKQVTW